MASGIHDALLLLRNNHDWVKAQDRFLKYTNGLCWAPSMEEEAQLQLNPNTIVRVKHPVLKAKMRVMYDQLCKAIPKIHLPLSDEAVGLFNKFKEQYPQLQPYSLASELAHYTRMVTEVNRERQLNRKANRQSFILWLANRYTIAVTKIIDIPCTCKNEDEIALRQVLPTGANTPEVICYNACDRTLFAAFKRQLMRVYEPDPTIVTQFKALTEDYFNKYVREQLLDFDYSFSQWYNKMPRNKQIAMDRAAEIIQDEPPKLVEYGLFCKREKQEAGGKNRAIANIEPTIKYIMGPVTWALEDIADKHFPGYCGKKNWQDLEDKFEQYYSEGFTYVLQGDGSAFDACQDVELKHIDRLVYNQIYESVYHVDPELFRKVSTARLRELNAKKFTLAGARPMASATILGTVFSGASDTTLMNTLRMALYNIFTLSRKGLILDRDYKLLCKGDDFMVFVRTPDFEGREWESIYMEVWCPKSKSLSTDYEAGAKGRLGMILKFLNVGGFETIDFCSTTCIPYDGNTKFKLARKPNRMNPLAHYSRNSIRFRPREFKQYLIDQAVALEISHGSMPFYRAYANAYRYWASTIPGSPQISSTGAPRRTLPDDGHRKVTKHDDLEFVYRDYGHEFVEGLRFRVSNRQPPDSEVYSHLLEHFDISPNTVDALEKSLINPSIYDPQY